VVGIHRIALSAGDVAITPATQWAPATHTWRGPRSFSLLGLLLAHRAPRVRRRRHSSRTKSVFAHHSSDRRARDCRRSQPTKTLGLRPGAHDLPLTRRSQLQSRSFSDPRDWPTLAAAEYRSRAGYRRFGSSAGAATSPRVAAAPGSIELRQVPRTDPMMISGNPKARPTV